MRRTSSAGTSVSAAAGIPAASSARRTRGRETPLSAAMSRTVAIGVLPCVTRSPATPGSIPVPVRLHHLLDRRAALGQVIEQREALGRVRIERVVEPHPLPELRVHPVTPPR